MPKVSVLMPVYNAEQFLAEAIDSIIQQSFQDWELIIIDDGSTDNSAFIISQYKDNRIYYLKNKENIGLIKSLNLGIDLCDGEYIARMDADDIATPNRLTLQAAFMDKHPRHILCGSNALVIDKKNEITGRIKNLTHNNYLQINLLFSVPFIHPSMLIRRKALADDKYNENYLHVEDFELWCRLSQKGEIANINRFLLNYRWHNTNVSVLNSEIQEKLKDKIITEQIQRLGLIPNNEELECHKITFNLYKFGNKLKISFEDMRKVEIWFSKLISKNREQKLFKNSHFIAYLWSRWCVLCISQKKYFKMLIPSFASLNPVILCRLIGLIFFLKQK